MLRGGGLFGRIGYDGSVYYASASALTHGLLPYRDFLLLHPPGITLALLPFAALGRLVGDPYAFALARLAWFGLGAVSTALVFAGRPVPRARGRRVAAAAFYAVFVPAVVSEHTTSLEAVGSVCLLGVGRAADPRARPADRARSSPLLAAGALLGVATGTKIWGVAVVLALVAWSVRRVGRAARGAGAGRRGRRHRRRLPAVLRRRARADVADGGRSTSSAGGGCRRASVAGFVDIAGLLRAARDGRARRPGRPRAGPPAASLVVLAVRDPLGRLAALLLVVTGAVLLSTPPWSVAYTGLAAPAFALLVGLRRGPARRPARTPPAGRAAVVVAGLRRVRRGLAAGADVRQPLPGPQPRAGPRRGRPAASTTDDPIALIETGALQRNFALGCPVVLDPSGYSYDLRPAAGRRAGPAEERPVAAVRPRPPRQRRRRPSWSGSGRRPG